MKKTFFASDFHLGARYIVDHRAHEARIVNWLDSIKNEAKTLYLLGDIFDYWFEYKTVIPRGYVRFLGKIAEMTDSGIDVHFFTGNHDAWIGDYLSQELRVTVHTEPIEVDINGKRFILGHGDNIGYDKFYSFMMWAFHNKFLQTCYRAIHPDLAGWIADTWSYKSRMSHFKDEARGKKCRPIEEEHQVLYAKKLLAVRTDIDYIIFGHRHEIFDVTLNERNARLLVIGDWIRHFSYAVFDGETLSIEKSK